MVRYFFQSSSAEKNANQLLSIWWGAKKQIGVYHNTPQIHAFNNYNIFSIQANDVDHALPGRRIESRGTREKWGF